MARIYELYELLFFTKQNGKLVNEFLATKKVMWQKLIVISGEDAPTTESTGRRSGYEPQDLLKAT